MIHLMMETAGLLNEEQGHSDWITHSVESPLHDCLQFSIEHNDDKRQSSWQNGEKHLDSMSVNFKKQEHKCSRTLLT